MFKLLLFLHRSNDWFGQELCILFLNQRFDILAVNFLSTRIVLFIFMKNYLTSNRIIIYRNLLIHQRDTLIHLHVLLFLLLEYRRSELVFLLDSYFIVFNLSQVIPKLVVEIFVH